MTYRWGRLNSRIESEVGRYFVRLPSGIIVPDDRRVPLPEGIDRLELESPIKRADKALYLIENRKTIVVLREAAKYEMAVNRPLGPLANVCSKLFIGAGYVFLAFDGYEEYSFERSQGAGFIESFGIGLSTAIFDCLCGMAGETRRNNDPQRYQIETNRLAEQRNRAKNAVLRDGITIGPRRYDPFEGGKYGEFGMW